jgi:putative FmdB family regulatory protein
MPLFEYTCPNCGRIFEKLVLTRKQEPPECPNCGWKKVEQMFSAFATASGTRSASPVCAPSGGG